MEPRYLIAQWATYKCLQLDDHHVISRQPRWNESWLSQAYLSNQAINQSQSISTLRSQSHLHIHPLSSSIHNQPTEPGVSSTNHHRHHPAHCFSLEPNPFVLGLLSN